MEQPDIQRTVIDGGYCIGCGACTAIPGSPYRIGLNKAGCFEASRTVGIAHDETEAAISKVCPFSDRSLDEDALARSRFSGSGVHDPHIGYHLGIYAGHVLEGDFRARGSSGGFGKWILYSLLKTGLVDAVVQVVERSPDSQDGAIYGFSVVHDPDDVLSGSRSAYYPVEMSSVLAYIRATPGRYAVTGIPCFMKAIRLLQNHDPVMQERIAFGIGIICGHLKSAQFADMLAWQFGVPPGDLQSIDFRAKLPGVSAKEKGVVVSGRSRPAEVTTPRTVQKLFGADYNHGFFQYKACDYCDDVVGETADVSVGDAWLPAYIPDGRGTSLLIVRNAVIHDLIRRAAQDGRVRLESVSVEDAVASQKGGFRQRREGLAYRLFLADNQGAWRPPKRVKPSNRHIDRRRKAIYRLRMTLTRQSFMAFSRAVDQNDFDQFRSEMTPLLEQYQELYRPTLIRRIVNGTLRRIKRWMAFQ